MVKTLVGVALAVAMFGMVPAAADPPTNVIVGTRHNDVLVGTRGRDTILGLRGSDRIVGGGAADQLFGNGGRDKIFSADHHADTVYGGRRWDRCTVDAKDVTYSCERVIVVPG